MNKFYTNVSQIGNYIYHRYIDEDGKRKEEYTDFVDIDLYVPSNDVTGYKSFYGQRYLKQVSFAKIRDAKSFIDEYGNIPNMEIHGNRNWWAQFISKTYPLEIDYDTSKLIIANIDIETRMTFDNGDQGFPEPDIAPAQVTAITVEIKDKYYVFGSKVYSGDLPENTQHLYCDDEDDLLLSFLSFWEKKKPDVITGWNIEGFDIPYLINRINNRLGWEQACRLSPSNRFTKNKSISIRDKKLDNGQTIKDYIIQGTAIADLLKLYRFYTFKLRERYSLDFIGHVELGERKLNYSEVSQTYKLLENSDDVKIDWNKNPEEMEEFVRWCRMRELIKKEKINRS